MPCPTTPSVASTSRIMRRLIYTLLALPVALTLHHGGVVPATQPPTVIEHTLVVQPKSICFQAVPEATPMCVNLEQFNHEHETLH